MTVLENRPWKILELFVCVSSENDFFNNLLTALPHTEQVSQRACGVENMTEQDGLSSIKRHGVCGMHNPSRAVWPGVIHFCIHLNLQLKKPDGLDTLALHRSRMPKRIVRINPQNPAFSDGPMPKFLCSYGRKGKLAHRFLCEAELVCCELYSNRATRRAKSWLSWPYGTRWLAVKACLTLGAEHRHLRVKLGSNTRLGSKAIDPRLKKLHSLKHTTTSSLETCAICLLIFSPASLTRAWLWM